MPSGPPTNSRQPSVSGQFSKPRGHRRGAQLGEERLTKGEIAVLKRTSYVNGRCFLPWLDTDVLESFVSHVPFEDKEGGILPLSPKQTRHLAGWRRPSEFMDSPVMIEAITPLSITQELVTDCSFVASLCVAATYEQRFRRQLVTRIIYPQVGFPWCFYLQQQLSCTFHSSVRMNEVSQCTIPQANTWCAFVSMVWIEKLWWMTACRCLNLGGRSALTPKTLGKCGFPSLRKHT